jgi:hypothetical protein
MARFEDALTGWDIYRSRNGEVSMLQLNAALRARGRQPVSTRTFKHYEKLRRLGYQDYLSINRLDVRHANDSVFDAADRSRYVDRPLDSPVRLAIPTADGLITLAGTARSISDGFATIRVPASPEAIAAARATKYDKGVLILDEVGVERAVEVTEAIDRGPQLDLVVAFRSLLPSDLLMDSSAYPRSRTTVSVDLGADAPLSQLLAVVRHTFVLFESVRGIVDLSAQAALDDEAPASPTPRVRHFEFSNPLIEIIIGATLVVTGVGLIVRKVTTAVNDVATTVDGVRDVQRNQNAERREQEFHEAKLKSMQLDNAKKAIELSSLIEAQRPELTEVLGVEIPQLPGPSLARANALKDQAIEAAVELRLASTDDIVIDQQGVDQVTADDGDG